MSYTAKASLALWRGRLKYRETHLVTARKEAHADKLVTQPEADRIHKWEANVSEAKKMIAKRQAEIAAASPLWSRAFEHAEALVGVMESGGNNVGPTVTKIIRANGGTGPEPWCGDFVAYCYRAAGSKAVTRAWASVWFLGSVAGLKTVKDPQRGDIVRFNFSHTGLFDKWIDRNAGTFQTIEGNTGAAGAVSDSSTGGDGVYRKRRQTSQVDNFRRVTR